MLSPTINTAPIVKCYHCGEQCKTTKITYDQKEFCCDGCKLVYDLLKDNSLCTYYNLNNTPGISPEADTQSNKFDFLDNEKLNTNLFTFKSDTETHVKFFVPKIHCSSCIWLLENLHKLHSSIAKSSVNFLKKEVTVIYNPQLIKLSEIANLITKVGYEPLVNLSDVQEKKTEPKSKSIITKIGIAGFCFGNSMMLSFPEYFSFGNFQENASLSVFFGYLNLLLSIPVFFYSASDFFVSAWKSLRYRYLNIDTPIALAILVTFSRSIYEITTHSGAGYIDSMTGIVFFMLIGRYFQNKTYETLSFERDYKSYFPVGVSVKKDENTEVNISVSELKKGDRIIIRSNQIIPCDSILKSESTHIDYSFITGEASPVKKQKGDYIYAGGKQLNGAVELEVEKQVSQSYLTQLWNKENKNTEEEKTYVDHINKYFTIAVLAIAFTSAAYWLYANPSLALNAFTAVLIVACPCGLLLTSTFANGNILRILGKNKLYLKNASVIEKIANINTIVFDKTGTITHGMEIDFVGQPLTEYHQSLIKSLTGQSSHPLSIKISNLYNSQKQLITNNYEEFIGQGIKACIDDKHIIIGSEYYVTGNKNIAFENATKVFVMIDGHVLGYYAFKNMYRSALKETIKSLTTRNQLELLSGDNDSEKETLKQVFGSNTTLLFNQKPNDKKEHIKNLQSNNKTVLMLGDGLNDAGALLQSDVGIAISDDTNSFSPACDAILDGAAFEKLPNFISFVKAGKKIIITTFVISLIYNIIGLSFATQGILSPVVAAILMPASSISIVLLSTLLSSAAGRLKGL